MNFHGDLSRHLIRIVLYDFVYFPLCFVEFAEMSSMEDPKIDET